MTIFLDPRAGSQQLLSYLRALDVPVDMSRQLDADVEFLAWGPDGPMLTGIEYKSVADCLQSMTDGRLTGTQLPRMLGSYSRNYLLIEGPTRVADDGVLEMSPRPGMWIAARGRAGDGWTAREWFGRLESITEFFGVRVAETFNIRESAAWIVAHYRYWSKQYHEHSSYRQWDHGNSVSAGRAGRAGNVSKNAMAMLLTPTSGLPLAQRWAAELPGIGQDKAGYIAKHFRTAAAMVLGDEREWRKVTFMEKLKKRDGYRKTHLSKERVAELRAAIWEGK